MLETQTRLNPFPGLRPFEAEEDYLFFGREGQTDELLRRLKRTRFLAIVGTSGSGKSSLVRAGLLPALYSGFMTTAGSSWRVAVMRPGNEPIANLARALNHADVFGAESEDAHIQIILTETVLQRGALGLVEVVQQARMPGDENLLVVVDQFEELFRFKQNSPREDAGDEAAAFVKLLLEATRQPELSIYVVLTMRSDFLGDCAQFRDLPEAINDSQYLIPRMTREQQRLAIEGPVGVGRAEITPRLVNRLINDVGDNPDQLPILQHALMRTWDYWESHHESGEPIDLRHYEAIGGMERALSEHADEIYDELPDDRSRRIAEKLFKCLTETGSDGRGIRRPTRLREICAVAEAEAAEVMAVIEQFRAPGRSFLMPPVGVRLDGDTVLDISHESLMRVWQRLNSWVSEEAQSAQIYRRLAETAALHQEGKAGLWRDPELSIALNWREQNKPNQAWAQRYDPEFERATRFLEASAVARDSEVAEKETARRRELKRLWGFITALVGLLLLASVAAVIAYRQSIRAEEGERNALMAVKEAEKSAQEALEAEKLAEQSAQKALAAGKLAKRREQEALAAKNKAQQSAKTASIAQKSETEQRKRAQQDQQRAEESQKLAEQQKSEAQKQRLFAIQQRNIAKRQTQEAIDAKAIAEKQKAIAENQKVNAEIVAQSLAAENLLASNLEIEALIESLRLGQRLKRQKSGVVEASTRMRAVATLQQVVYGVNEYNRLQGHGGGVTSVSFSPDGQSLASTGGDGKVKLWSRDGQLLKTFEHGDGVNSVSFSPDGQSLASAGYDGKVKLWSRDGQPLKTFEHGGWVTSVSFSPDGQSLASAGLDGKVKLWSRDGQLLKTFEHGGGVNSVSFSPDGQSLASAGNDGKVKLWNLNLDDLLVRGCNWLRNYLRTNPNVSESDKHLCDRIPTK